MRIQSWRESFDRQYVERINVQIISTINDMIGCRSDREFSSACGKDRWISHLDESGESRRPLYYDRLRECAYFLGVPPWLLVAGTAGNEQIRALFEAAPSELERIDFMTPEKSFGQLKDFFSKAPLRKVERTRVDSSLSIIEQYIPSGTHTAFNSIEDLLLHAKRQHPGFRFAHDFQLPASTGPDYRGTLCFAKGEYEHGEKRIVKKQWSSVWFAVEIDKGDHGSDLNTRRLIQNINDSLQFQHHWAIEVDSSPATTIFLASWHTGVQGPNKEISGQMESDHRRKIETIVKNKLRDTHFLVTTVHAHDPVIENIPSELAARERYTEFLSWISEDVETKNRITPPDKLNIAVENGFIYFGQELYFNRRFLPKQSILGIQQPVVTVVQHEGESAVSFNGQVFPLPDLTLRILRELRHHAWIPRYNELELYWGFDELYLEPFIASYSDYSKDL